MPALVADYQKQALKTQAKKALSFYSQNLQKTAMIDFDGNTGCYYANTRDTSNCLEFFDKFAGNLKVIKACTGSALADGCIPKYNLFASATGCNGYNQNNVNNVNTAYVLADGSIMIPYKESGGCFRCF
jgi:hypothetical protein